MDKLPLSFYGLIKVSETKIHQKISKSPKHNSDNYELVRFYKPIANI